LHRVWGRIVNPNAPWQAELIDDRCRLRGVFASETDEQALLGETQQALEWVK